MKIVTLKRDGQYGSKGSNVEVTDDIAKQLIGDGVASEFKSERKRPSNNKALSAKE